MEDEEVYKCTTTYVDPRETCTSFDSYSIQLNVLGNLWLYSIQRSPCLEFQFDLWFISVAPASIELLDEHENPIVNATTIGPLREGQQFTSICLIKKTRPEPLVTWYRSGKRLQGECRQRTWYKTKIKIEILFLFRFGEQSDRRTWRCERTDHRQISIVDYAEPHGNGIVFWMSRWIGCVGGTGAKHHSNWFTW